MPTLRSGRLGKGRGASAVPNPAVCAGQTRPSVNQFESAAFPSCVSRERLNQKAYGKHTGEARGPAPRGGNARRASLSAFAFFHAGSAQAISNLSSDVGS